MAERLAYLEAVIGADITQFRKGMRDIRNETGILSETISGISGAARTATFAISAPLATLSTYTVQAASDFDAAMRNINSITGMSEAELNKLSDAVREFSSTTRGGAVDAANSLYTVFSAGVTDIELAMNTMEVATKTADAGLADMETTTEALVASMLSYGTEVVSAERASDSLTQMVQIGVGSMQNFANSLSKALPSAAALGVEIEDLYASMAYMTQRSFSASEAATAINQGMSSLMKPTEDMEKAMRSLGANGVEELMDKYNTLGDAIKALVDTTDGSSASIAKLFSNIRGKRFVDTILNDFETYKQTMEEFNRTVVGATDRAYAEQMKSFAAQWDLMTSAVENASIAIGLELLPVLAPVIGKIAELFTALSQLEPITLKMGVAFAGLLIVIPPLIWLLSSLVNPLGALITFFGAVTVNMVSAQGGITGFIDSLEKAVPQIGNIRREIDRIFGEPYQSVAPTPEELGLYSYEYAPADFVTMQSGDTVWDYFLTRMDTNQTWDDFKDEWIARNGKLTFSAGDLVELPTGSFMEWMGEELMSVSELGEAYRKQQVYTSDFYEMNTDTEAWSVPLELQMLQLRQALDDNIKPAIIGIGTQIGNWFGNSFKLALKAIDEFGAEFFDGITKTLFTTKIGLALGVFNTDILSEKIGEFFKIDLLKPFGNLVASFDIFFHTFVDWLITVGLPVLFRGIGRFVAESANLLIKVLSGLGDLLKGVNIASIVANLAHAITDPFMQGINDTFGAKTLTALKNKFETAGLKILLALNGIFDQLKSYFTVDTLSDFIGTIFDFDPKKTFPTLFSGLKILATNIGNWLLDVGIPMVAKGVGRFIGEMAILFSKGFASLTSLISPANLLNTLQTIIDTFITPFIEGIEDSFDINFTFNDFITNIETGIVNIITFIRSMFATITSWISPTALGDAIALLFNFDTNTTILPNVTANFSALLSDIGDWIITDGIPLLAYGIGRLWGEVGILLGKGLAGLGEYVQGNDFSNATSSLSQGFNDALADEGITSWVDAYATAFGGAIVLALGASAIYSGVGTAISQGIGLALTLGKLAGKGIIITAEFALKLVISKIFGGAVVGQIATMGWAKFIGMKLASLMGVAGGALKAGAVAAGGVVAKGAAAAATAIAGAGAGTIAATVAVVVGLGLIIGAVALGEDGRREFGERISNFFAGEGWYTDADLGKIELEIPDFEIFLSDEENKTMFDSLTPVMQTALQNLFEDGTITPEEFQLVFDSLSVELADNVNVDTSKINWETIFDNIVAGTGTAGTYNLDEAIPMGIQQDEFGNNFMEENQYALTLSQNFINSLIDELETVNLNNEQQRKAEEAGKLIAGNIMQGTANGISKAYEEIETDPEIQILEPIIYEASDIVVFENEDIESEARTFAIQTLGAVSTALTDEISAEEYNTDVLEPFKLNWLALFGEEGSLTTSTSDFFTNFATGMTNIESQLLTTSTNIVAPLNAICTEMETAMTCITTSMDKARESISKLLTEIRKLASVSTSLEISVRVTGTINAPTGETVDVDSSSANGLEYVARDGHIAELHKGEMVVPSTIASNLRRIGDVSKSILDGSIGGGGKGGDTYTTQHNQINIYGVDNVDDLLAELERRGIYL